MKEIFVSILCPRKSSLLWSNKKTRNKYGTTIANMSEVMNEQVNICCKAFMNQVFTVVGLIVKLGTEIAKSNSCIYASPSIRQPYVTVTSNSNVVYLSLLSSFFTSTLQYHF